MNMHITLVLLSVLLFGIVCGAEQLEDDEVSFKEFMGKYGKSYANDDEYSFRLQAYKQNKAFIERHNSKPARTHDVAMNSFGDLTHEEYKAKRVNMPLTACYTPMHQKVHAIAAPDNLDWRASGNVPPVENEGQCGANSYINVAHQVSSAISITINRPPVPLSAQQMMDCYSSPYDNGCNGADPWDLYLYIGARGLEPLNVYPFTGLYSNGTCMYNKSQVVAAVTGFQNLTNEADARSAVATYGPIIALFDSTSQEFAYYSSGIYTDYECSQDNPNDDLLIVGYGVTTGGTEYWIAQNVWGTGWGMNGYINILRGVNTYIRIGSCTTYVTGAYVINEI